MIKSAIPIIMALIMFSLFSLFSHAQSKSDFQSVTLKGRVIDSLIKNKPGGKTTVRIYISKYPFDGLSISQSKNKLYEFDIKYNELFQLNIVPPAKRFYLYLYYHPEQDIKDIRRDESWSSHDNVYTVYQGDSLYVELGKDDFKFSGKGSDKLNCESEIYQHTYIYNRIPDAIGGKISSLLNAGLYKEYRNLMSFKRDSCFNAQVTLLKKYRPVISNVMADIMLANCYGLRYYNEFRGYSQLWDVDSKTNKEILQSKEFRKADFNIDLPDSIVVQAPIYLEALFQKIKLEERFDKEGKFEMNDYYLRIFHRIENYPAGIIKDKLFALFFIVSLPFYDTTPYLEPALKECGPSLYKEILVSFKKSRGHNVPFYPFSLPDTQGKLVTLASLKDKIVIMDFWYTGCENCIILREGMKKIEQRYHGDNRVVFLSVSIDKNKAMWLKSVKSGKYTGPEGSNLYTRGKGVNDGLLINYSINSFPYLFIVKNGSMFSANPPRPLSPTSSQEFVAIIDSALSEYKN